VRVEDIAHSELIGIIDESFACLVSICTLSNKYSLCVLNI
jgi:hypothetical protein